MPRSIRDLIERSRIAIWLPPLVALVIVGVVWQIVGTHNPLILATPSLIYRELVNEPHLYISNAWTTLQEALFGTAVSFVVATALAIAMSEVRSLERAIMPLAVIVNVTPVVSIAPALVIAFGFGIAPKYIITGLITFFPFLVNALIGLRSADPGVLELLASLHASRREVLWRLRLPGSLPFLFAALRVCLPLSIVGAVVAEFVAAGNERGLGSLIATSEQNSQLSPIYAAVCVLAFIGLVLTGIVLIAERRLLSWHVSQRPRLEAR